MSLRLIFMGTPHFAVPTLAALIGQGHEIVAVYTRAPKPAGRGMAEQKTPVHGLADQFGIPVFTPKSLRNEEETARFAAFKADAAIVVPMASSCPSPSLRLRALAVSTCMAPPCHAGGGLRPSSGPSWRVTSRPPSW